MWSILEPAPDDAIGDKLVCSAYICPRGRLDLRAGGAWYMLDLL